MTTTRIHAAPVEQVNVRSRHPGFVDADSTYRHVVRRLRADVAHTRPNVDLRDGRNGRRRSTG